MKKAEIGQYLARRRKSLELNQRELAKLSGISLHSLCNIERGESNPTIDALLAVTDVLGLEFSLSPRNMELVSGDGR